MRLIMTSVPTSYRSADFASVSSERSGRTVIHPNSFSGVASAASTAATERGRPTPSGTTVSGNIVMFCSASTGTSNF